MFLKTICIFVMDILLERLLYFLVIIKNALDQ